MGDISKGFYKIGNLFKYFAVIFLPIMMVLLVVLFAVNSWQTEKNKQILIEREHSIGMINKLNIESIFNTITADLNVIKNSDEVREYVNKPTTQSLNEINNMFVRYSKSKTIYDQIRLMNTEGIEVVRINYNNGEVYVVKDNDLQNKGNEDAFIGTLNLGPEEIYISQFDLNVEDGKIEEPIKPTIRFGVPIFKNNGEKFGALIFNYSAIDVLEEINENMKGNNNFNIQLLNSEGYFLKSIDEKNNWNFMYKDKKHISFKSENEDIWNAITQNESGKLEDKKNIYYYNTIYPLSRIQEKKDTNFSGAKGYTYWKSIISYPNEEFRVVRSIVGNGFLGIGFVFLLLSLIRSIIISHIIIKRQGDLKRVKTAGSVFDYSKEAIIVTDTETRITYVNKAFLDITGYKEEEVLNEKTSSFKSGKHDRKFYQDMWKAIATYGNWEGEIWDKKKDGTLYPKLLKIIAIKDNEETNVYYLGIFEDLTAAKEKEESINLLKNYDQLTLLPNLSLMKELVTEKIIINSHKENYRYNFISLSITNYDSIKHSLNSEKSDLLILNTLKRIRRFMEDNFIIGSLGKVEFMIFLEETKNNDIVQFVNNILNEFKNPFITEEQEVYVQLSIGVASYEDYQDTLETIIENANIAKLYAVEEAEETESNVQFYKADFKNKYLENIKMKHLLRGALQRGEIYLTYQPQVELVSGQITGVEALIRWKSPELGSVSPVKFIPMAEKAGLMPSIGKWIIDEACRQNKIWRDEKLKPIRMSVNISPIQFKKTHVFKIIQDTLNKYDLNGESLEIEVTEGLLLDENPALITQLDNINKIGVALAMDDFGTGYSSLSYLRKFKFDKIKIDREFVKDYPEKDDGLIAKTIINLSRSLSIKVIAEGAETQEHINFLKENQCDQVQGYYYSPPVSPKEFGKLLKNGFLGQ